MSNRPILLVEDNPDDVELTRIAFAEAKIANPLHVVGNGVEALDYLFGRGAWADQARHEPPALVLLDLNMPRMDGRQTLDALKESDALRDIPVVMLTTSESERDVLECYRKHCAAFLTKPVTVEELIEKLQAVCRLWLSGIAALPNRPVQH